MWQLSELKKKRERNWVDEGRMRTARDQTGTWSRLDFLLTDVNQYTLTSLEWCKSVYHDISRLMPDSLTYLVKWNLRLWSHKLLVEVRESDDCTLYTAAPAPQCQLRVGYPSVFILSYPWPATSLYRCCHEPRNIKNTRSWHLTPDFSDSRLRQSSWICYGSYGLLPASGFAITIMSLVLCIIKCIYIT